MLYIIWNGLEKKIYIKLDTRITTPFRLSILYSILKSVYREDDSNDFLITCGFAEGSAMLNRGKSKRRKKVQKEPIKNIYELGKEVLLRSK